MQETPKPIKRLVREWAGIAHDRELGRALLDLREQFERWLRREISPVELNDLIHRFHDGISRDIWKKYATNRLEPAIGFAIATGILRREELPSALLEHVSGLVEFYQAEEPASLSRLTAGAADGRRGRNGADSKRR
jgi:hypothetical protein